MMKMNTKAFGTLVLLTVLVIGVVFISGCVEAPEETPPEVITPPEEIGLPTLDVAGEDVSDLPRYPGSVRVSYWSMDFGDGGKKLSIGYITSASLDEVMTFYEKELPANGWTDIITMQMEGDFMLVGHKEGASAQINISPDIHYPDHTLIMLSVLIYIT